MRVSKRTVTEKRLAANRAAATQSTGPRTAEGKRRSAFNSFQHGLYATQDAIIRQAFVRAGLDPAQYDNLHQELAASFAPQDAMQALLVEDLTRLYWLKNLSQRSTAEWQARQAERFGFECAKRRHEARRREPVIHEAQVAGGGWLWVESCPEKFERVYKLLETLEALASTAAWSDGEEEAQESASHAPDSGRLARSSERQDKNAADHQDEKDELDGEEDEEEQEEQEDQEEQGPSLAEAVLREIYGRQFTWTGKRIQRLFAQCAEDQAFADDPRISRLRALIGEERESVQEEQQLYEQERELKIAQALSPSDPALHPLSDVWADLVEQETAFDRQIAAKIRLLMKLQAAARERAAADNDTVTADPADRVAPDSPLTVVAAAATDESDEKDENSGTNPKTGLSRLQSAGAYKGGEFGIDAQDREAAPSGAAESADVVVPGP